MVHANIKTKAKPRRLPTVNLDGVDYFVDHRLEQFRAVTNPHDFVDFDTDRGRQMLGQCVWLDCDR